MPTAPKKRYDRFALIVLACGGLVMMAAICSPYWKDIAAGHTDFLAFYAGGRLAFSPGLYDPQQAMAEQLRTAHVLGEGTYFIRLPWFAAAMWPLARLPYIPAQFLWQFLLICGLIAFVVLWPSPSFALRATIFCYSFPAIISLRMGQDVPLLLSCMAVSLALVQREKPLLAGLVLSLVLAKFHLFLPLFPAVLFARRWRFATGLFGGAAFLLASGFLVNGPGWPQRFLAAIRDPATTPQVTASPSVYYLLHGSPVAIGAIGIILMILYLRIARRDTEVLIAAAPLAILPLLPHAGAYDCLLLTPMAMTALDRGSRPAKIAATLLLIPPVYFVAWSFTSWAFLIPVLGIALLALYAMPSPGRVQEVVADRRAGRVDGELLHLAD